MDETKGVQVGCRNIRFADDILLLSDSEWTMNAMLPGLNASCEECRIRIHTKKTKCMVINA